MSEFVNEFSISASQIQDYEFRIKFDKEDLPEITMDEPSPLGQDKGVNASRLLAAAVGHCLSASLLFCTRKGRVDAGPIHTQVKVQIVRNKDRRLRVGRIEVSIDPGIPDSEREKAKRCVGLFEDFCMVTQSVRNGIDVAVSVKGFS
jgi:organic hydroperoxide reductase OsmC/OhrA